MSRLFPSDINVLGSKFSVSNDDLRKIIDAQTKLDPCYVVTACILERRQLFESLWVQFEPSADRHFKKEIQKQFHQRTWEMYLANVLIDKNMPVKSYNKGPDLIVDNSIYIECIAPTNGDLTKPNSVPKVDYSKCLNKVVLESLPTEQMILRVTHSIGEKEKQYQGWLKKEWVDREKPFIIAINTGSLDHLQEDDFILKVLFGLDCIQISESGKISHRWREHLVKDGADISVTGFTNAEKGFISGILFSNTTALNHPENLGDDCVFVNNPYANNPVGQNFVSLFDRFQAELDNGVLKINFIGKETAKYV